MVCTRIARGTGLAEAHLDSDADPPWLGVYAPADCADRVAEAAEATFDSGR